MARIDTLTDPAAASGGPTSGGSVEPVPPAGERHGRRGARPQRRSITRSRAAALIMIVGFGVTASWVGAFAAFTDDVTASATFSTGTLAIQANDLSTTATTTLGITSLVPGLGNYAPIKIANVGTVPFTYTMATNGGAEASLIAALTLGIVKTAGATCTAATYATAALTPANILVADTTALASSALAARSLAASGVENLCFHVSLLSSAGNALQGKTTTAAFTFTATSV